jgi:hypothetical protein
MAKRMVAKRPKPNDPGKWASSVSEAKSKFKVYPSAYANAYASKQYKAKGGTWRGPNNKVT